MTIPISEIFVTIQGEGQHQGGMHASHIDHTRGNGYDDPDNGHWYCQLHHLQDHINRHGRNGLTEEQNNC